MERQSFRLVVLGGRGAGKTSFLVAMLGSLTTTDGARRFWLDPAGLRSLDQVRALGTRGADGYPRATQELISEISLSCKMMVGLPGRVGLRFSNLLRPGAAAGHLGSLFDLVACDYPGDWLETPGAGRDGLHEALHAADALVVAVDGELVLALLRGETRGRAYVKEALPRLLDLVGPIQGTRAIPACVVLTKWDLLDSAGFGLARVRDRLLSEVEGLRHLVELDPAGRARLIPVSTAGHFRQPQAEGEARSYAEPLSTPDTTNLAVPIALVFPGFAREVLAQVRRHRRRRVLVGASWAALALVSAIGHAISALVLVGKEIGKQVGADQTDVAADAGTIAKSASRFAEKSRQAALADQARLIRNAAHMAETVRESSGAVMERFGKEFSSSDLAAAAASRADPNGTRSRGRPSPDPRGDRTLSQAAARVEAHLDETADRLALWARAAAEAEVRTRGLEFPAPLGFRWVRRSGSGGPAGPEVACHPSRLVEAYEEREPDTLMVTAGPGAGKTVLSLLLVRGIAERRLERGIGPVPVSIPLSNWSNEALPEWIEDQISLSHPWLGALGGELLHSGRLLVVLDGVDEMPAAWIGGFLERLARLPAAIPLLVTCRTTEYSLSGPEWAQGRLADAEVIQLLPASVDEVFRYIRDSSPAEVHGEWLPLKALLLAERNTEFRRVLTTPLTAWLVARLYAARPADFIGYLGNEPDVRRLQTDLLRSILAGGTRREAVVPSASRMLRSLARIIREMPAADDREAPTGQDFAWWRLADIASVRKLVSAAAGVFGGLVTAVAVALGTALVLWGHVTNGSALAASLVLGIVAGGYVGYACATNSPEPSSLQVQVPKRMRASVRAGVIVAVVGCAAGIAVSTTVGGALLGLLMAVPVALTYAFLTTEVDSRLVASPRALYRSDLTQSVIFTAAYALSIGTVGSWYRGPLLGVLLGLASGITGGMTYGIVFELAFVDRKARRQAPTGLVAWLRFRFAMAWLAFRGRLPWRIFRFLGQMHQAGLLRQVGPVYQFRHLMLLEELAREEGKE